jgi:threonine synthase
VSDRSSTLPMVSTNAHWQGYRCVVCGLEQPTDFADMVCPVCGVDGILDVIYDYAAIRAELPAGTPFANHPAGGYWRFAPLLPVVPDGPHPAWSLTTEPVLRADRLAAEWGLDSVILKDDTRLPSGSLKDRAAAMALVAAHGRGLDHLACASTGNAAASLAVLAARAGFSCTIFVPAAAPQAKLAQLLVHGAHVTRVDGTYDQAFDLSLHRIEQNQWYSRNCAHNPLLVEGKKTAALELALELLESGSDELPEAVFVPVGDGCIVSSVAKAFGELVELGLIDHSPAIWGVQAAGASPLAVAWNSAGAEATRMSGAEILSAVEEMHPDTIADSISVGIPRNRVKAWKYVAASGGGFLSVSDQEILAAIRTLATQSGLFAEPSGAAGLAGLRRALDTGLVHPGSRVAVMVTGNGLKDPLAALHGIRIPDPIPPERR